MIGRTLAFGFLWMLCAQGAWAQCFASAGNPVGGTANLGVMDKKTFRLGMFYRFSYSHRYLTGDKKYTGSAGILKDANFNYLGLLIGYGILDQLTVEAESGYYINKTQVYKLNNLKLKGYGLSNAVVSLKPRLYYNADKRFEISCALGANIPFAHNFQAVDGVTLPVDLQASTGSFGMVFQTFIIKEYSFEGIRFFLTNRIEKYFINKQEYLFGTMYSTSFFFSKHFVFEKLKLKDWTFIFQLKNQIKEKNKHFRQPVDASGSVLLFVVPQVNVSINDNWNVSVMADIPVYQYYNKIQLANTCSVGLSVFRDFSFEKKQKLE
ncbi:MAG TPA: hypothetical protein PLB59_08605 [Bacteroidales bacterium]|nr:hypothetical protein [Bacteroidales bacterium]HPB26209.1 hypothetical protein [Bacteroidales bacterium]HPI30426.1 hypothetical protein [Bacteroidales bacterium]HQN17056.1 hypothetical protein [Bacteroidales bacterium]HQP16016.1 hypothetical protein [Bacteroidales bacterium]